LIPFTLVAIAATSASAAVGVFYEPGAPRIEFAAAELLTALKATGEAGTAAGLGELSRGTQQVRIAIAASKEEEQRLVAALGLPGMNPAAAAQSFSIRKKIADNQTTYAILAADSAGAMYGTLDIAEAVRLGTLAEILDADRSPFIARRGIKFNIPLDARTPSYSDAGDSAQQNIPEMWSIDFWHEFLDEMARQRFNTLSLWNLHPFPSMVKVPEYPDVALADVMRTTEKFDSTYALTALDMVRPSQLTQLETLKKMTIEEKISFWREVMDYANDRGIDVYLFTWNIFVWGADGKYGITSAQDNPVTIDYFRKSVRETILTYPRLAGLGITGGENMKNLPGEFSKEQWLLRTYGEGIADAKKLQPDRTIRLIHRMHQGNLGQIVADWKEFPGPFDVSYKYSMAHMYSSTNPPMAKRDLANLPTNLRTWMTVRNDDIYSFRWGDPEFARAYLRGLPGPDVLAGYYMGPDGYTWGREFISTEPETPRQLVLKKQWYSFMLWGRLSYDPSLPDALFQRTLDVRFPQAAPGKLFAASAAASKIIPQINRCFWWGGGNDLAWFPEACISHPKHQGFYTVRHFMNGSSMAGSGIVNIRDYCAAIIQDKQVDGISPPQVAAMLKAHAAETLRLTNELPQNPTDKELRLTVGDLNAMAYLGNYYADKIMGATDLAVFNATGKLEKQESAVNHLQAAVENWRKYAELATRQYRPQLLTRVGYVDLNALTAKVEQDVEIAKTWKSAQP
ncbi:MAG: carbohydrate-binding family 6 protein, partial [Burkholderiales bacterium]|nr:carbohydrate-binding family 6 protein [Phycisphaerae bacterium]